jgi:hypothetical protein
MQRYELAVIRRALTWVIRVTGTHRLLVTADRGFADVALFGLLDALGVACIIRVSKGTMVQVGNVWCPLKTLRFQGNSRHRSFGRVRYCRREPHAVWLTMSRARDKAGQWGVWYLVSNRPEAATQAAREYSHRIMCPDIRSLTVALHSKPLTFHRPTVFGSLWISQDPL